MSKGLLRIIVLIIALGVIGFRELGGKKEEGAKPGCFAFEKTVRLPGTPEAVYDLATGDISGWWDHTFSEKPARLFIEPRPGGGFYEIFDDSGDGVLHGTVIYAQRGKLLRFTGPLGLSGNAIDLVCTYKFEPIGADSTQLTLNVHAAGESEKAWPGVVEQIWTHFLVERFKPFVEGRLSPNAQ